MTPATARYYALVASLPRLEHFESADRLPISRRRLDQRLAMLRPDHAADLKHAERLVSWQRQPALRTEEQVAALYDTVLKETCSRTLREFVEYRMAGRTIVAAMRRRNLGLPPPPRGGTWGVGRWSFRLPDRHDRPDFGLSSSYPWIPAALRLLQEGNAVGLERLLMNDIWSRLTRIAGTDPFGFEQVFAFFFKWDILRRWLSHDASRARERFGKLIGEAIGEHELHFD